MSLVNYLGTYETLDQVWETYPEGGKEGDYLYIASVLKKWNKYTSAWADPTEEDVEGSTIMSLEEDVVVGSSTLINYLGRFETLENAINTYPEGGNEGDYIYVGDDIYAWDKYANGWFVSSDAPLEVAISEEDIIPDSNTFVNYLGGFVDRDAVWHKYPEGGKVGDYLYIASDLHIWDKYICNWVAATPPDESSQIRPIEHLSQEGVVEYSENYINYLGVFESIEQAWEAYPEGGKEGDYIIVDGEQLRWNKYTNNWGEYDPDASTPARPVATIYGDLHVHNDVIIGEDLYARILETFTTKKWVLEQGYISLDDVTSELVMSKIVPDNTTIEVRDGKLVVIGGGGGGTADSVAWDNITGKPEWIGDTKPTYTLDEIAGSNGDGFVTLLSNQTIEGMKNFANGAKFNGALLSYDEEKKAWVFPGNIIASGGITAFGSLSTPVVSLFEALPIDGTTIKRDPVTNELYVDTKVVGGSGGGSLDEEQLEEFLRPYATIVYVSNNYASKTSVDKALSDKANKATTLAGYGITDAYTKRDIDATVDSINTSISNLRKYADDTFVTISTPQRITARHNFIDGLKINGLPIYNSQDDVVYIDANLVVRGGVTAWGTNEETAPNIFEGLPIDGTSIYWDNGVLKSSATSSGGINEELLEEYLLPYATQSWVMGRGYITSDALSAYLPKTGGYLTGNVIMTDGVTIRSSEGNVAGTLKFGADTANFRTILGTATRETLLIGTTAIKFWRGANSKEYTMLDSYNYSDYALPKDGVAASASKLQKAVSLWGRSFDGTADLTGSLVVSTGEGYRINYNGYDLRFIVSGNSSRRGIWDNTNSEWMMYRSSTTNIIFPQGNIAIGSHDTPTDRLTITGSINASESLKLTATPTEAFADAQMLFAGGKARIGVTASGFMGLYANTFTFRPSSTTSASTSSFTIDANANLATTGKLTLPIGSSNYTNASLWFGDSVRIGVNSSNSLGIFAGYAIRLNPDSATSASTTKGLWLLNSGYNGVNNTTPTEALDVVGNIKTSGKVNVNGGILEYNSTLNAWTLNGNLLVTGGVSAFSNINGFTPSTITDAVMIDNTTIKRNAGGSLYAVMPNSMNGDLAISGRLTTQNNIVAEHSSNPFLALKRDGTTWYCQVTSSGIKLGQTSAKSINVDASGNLTAIGSITPNTSSDERLKRNLRKFNASKVLMSLGGVWEYEYIDSEVAKNHIYEGTHYGLIYQHVKGTTLDVMCHEREDGMGALNYIHPKFISLIAGATMENISEVEKLKRKIQHLEAKVKQLENRV